MPDFQVMPALQVGSTTLHDLLKRLDAGGPLSVVESQYLASEVRHQLAKLARVQTLAQTYANSLTKISMTVSEEVMATRRAG